MQNQTNSSNRTLMRHCFSAILIAITLSSCNVEEARINIEAKELGQKHALELSDKSLSDKELKFKLLEIRANETALRSAGHPKAADTYIQTFSDSLKVHNDSLANLIF